MRGYAILLSMALATFPIQSQAATFDALEAGVSGLAEACPILTRLPLIRKAVSSARRTASATSSLKRSILALTALDDLIDAVLVDLGKRETPNARCRARFADFKRAVVEMSYKRDKAACAAAVARSLATPGPSIVFMTDHSYKGEDWCQSGSRADWDSYRAWQRGERYGVPEAKGPEDVFSVIGLPDGPIGDALDRNANGEEPAGIPFEIDRGGKKETGTAPVVEARPQLQAPDGRRVEIDPDPKVVVGGIRYGCGTFDYEGVSVPLNARIACGTATAKGIEAAKADAAPLGPTVEEFTTEVLRLSKSCVRDEEKAGMWASASTGMCRCGAFIQAGKNLAGQAPAGMEEGLDACILESFAAVEGRAKPIAGTWSSYIDTGANPSKLGWVAAPDDNEYVIVWFECERRKRRVAITLESFDAPVGKWDSVQFTSRSGMLNIKGRSGDNEMGGYPLMSLSISYNEFSKFSKAGSPIVAHYKSGPTLLRKGASAEFRRFNRACGL